MGVLIEDGRSGGVTAPAAFAAARFGLGARPGELAIIGRDPRGWVESQLQRPAPLPAALAGKPSSAEILAEVMEAHAKGGPAKVGKLARENLRAVYLNEVAARTQAAIETDHPVFERLVQFWSNHFTVSVRGKPFVLGIPGAYEREAIRPHVLGRFEDMLRAVVEHPAMLVYLDNWLSVGPDSIGGRRRNKGLNENLAREIMELHTLGVDGGYTQADVTTFAKVLTGWTVTPLRSGDPGHFRFMPQIHEPGDKVILGRPYAEGGKAEGDAVLRDLAHHPSTARFIATKLARHFIADDPPPDAVDRLARRFQETGGDLGAVTRTLVALPEAWPKTPNKIKTPNELVISAFRALGGAPEEPLRLVQSLAVLEQPTFSAPSPAGWPDKASDWIGPEAAMKRIEWVHVLATRWPREDSPITLASDVLGDGVAPTTSFAFEHAASARDGVAYVLLSPEFQRR
ncbi:MAG TPA: DUF1800 domain-containing protein [Candidatus Sulfotelmatobacter sp.]|nr:DUF1800 domain-containing protein [Candidatus Sulfotelmatobacter sp.]